jgi:L-ascorbate metabolism protein UlaG (beta-lactamase superfamily)
MRRVPLALLLLAGCTAVPQPRNATYHPSDADLSVTRIINGSLVLEMTGTTVLIDPWFHSTLAARQVEPLGLTPEKLPEAAAVLLTHTHADHFDPAALGEIAKKVPRAIVPPPLAQATRDLGFKDVTALDWWESTDVGPIHVTAVPASHPVRENGYVLATGRARAYVAGDTRYFDGLVDIATAFPHLDVAFLPISGEQFLGFHRTMTPSQAVKAATVLDAKHIVPFNYGKLGGFPLVWYPSHRLDRFRDQAKEAGISPERIVVLEPGESWHYYR